MPTKPYSGCHSQAKSQRLSRILFRSSTTEPQVPKQPNLESRRLRQMQGRRRKAAVQVDGAKSQAQALEPRPNEEVPKSGRTSFRGGLPMRAIARSSPLIPQYTEAAEQPAQQPAHAEVDVAPRETVIRVAGLLQRLVRRFNSISSESLSIEPPGKTDTRFTNQSPTLAGIWNTGI